MRYDNHLHSRSFLSPHTHAAAALARSLVYLAMFGVCAVMLLPFAWALISSLKPLDEAYAFPPTFWTSSPQWSNYPEAMTRLPMTRFLLNSFIICSASVSGAVLTSSMAGYALARFQFSGRSACILAVVASMLIPAQVLLVPRFLIYDLLGWVGTYKPLIVPAWLGGGAFNVFLFRQFFRTMPREQADAARLDGATAWQVYAKIALPFARPAVIAAALLSFVYHWQEFLDPLIYLSDFNTYPVSLGLRMYQSMAGTWMNLLMAASLIALVPLVVVFVLCERQLMRGLEMVR